MSKPALKVEPTPSICQFRHHDRFGQVLICKKCGGIDVACGPFGHACPTCEPREFRRCTICGKKRIFCSC